ncbi:MAG: UvrD-helicase domain-containing protein [Anaerohalosphaeraceae bacterium]|nr:UvrD-helicase domain-containing protein [Anaerohalosphaeraceae bacterium]
MNSSGLSSTITLTKSQQQAVEHKDGAMLVIAGPGSGKTRVITSRIAELIKSGVSPYNICAITFTNKAAEEMRNRVIAMHVSGGVHISTFHSLCVRILRQYAAKAKITPNFSIYDDSDQKKCIKEAIKTADLDTKNFQPRRMLEMISRLKNNLESPQTLEADNSGDYFSKCLSKIYKNYQAILDKHNALDFDDLLLKTAFLLRDDADVRKQLNDRFKYLMVDEYQDTNHAQYQIARGLAMISGNICVTGDPDQSVYGWRGADIANIMAFEKDWPNAKVVKLEENFRSGAAILAVAEKLIGVNKNRKAKKLIAATDIEAGVTSECLEDEQAEAVYVADYVKELIAAGSELSEIAVFYRVNSMSRALEEAFIDGRINYQIVRGVEFYGRKEIRDMLAYLKVVTNPDDEISLLRAINTPPRGIGKVTIEKIGDYARQEGVGLYDGMVRCASGEILSRRVGQKISAFVCMIENFKKHIDEDVSELIDVVFHESGLFDSLKIEQDSQGHSQAAAIDNIYELINGAKKFDENSQEKGLVNYLQQIALFSDTDTYDSQSGKVSLMTLHAAKGLEFDNVIIIGAEHGILPHERSFDLPSEMEEERRLFFVGITRARKNLAVTMSRYRTVYGQTKRTIASQFLFEAGIAPEQEPVFEAYESPKKSGYGYEDNYSQAEGESPSKAVSSGGSSKGAFTAGEMVSHKKFGLGRVREFHNLGGSSVVMVQFNSGQTKSLMLKYANLTKIG